MMYVRLQAAARREQWAVRLWWSFMALATAIALAVLLRHANVRTDVVVAGVFLWMAAWLAPWTAVLSLRRKRPAVPPPAPGQGTLEEWRRFARNIGLFLDWSHHAAQAPDLRVLVGRAQNDLRRILRKKSSRQDIEDVTARIIDETVLPLRRALWQQLMPEIMPVAAEARERGTTATSEEIFRRIQHNAMTDAASVAVCRLYPSLLMNDLEHAVQQCVGAAAFYAKPGDPLVLLVAAIAIEWGNFVLPWEPYRARCAAMELIGSVDPEASLKFHSAPPAAAENLEAAAPDATPVATPLLDKYTMVAPDFSTQSNVPPPPPPPQPAEAAPPVAEPAALPESEEHHHHHHHHHHSHSSSLHGDGHHRHHHHHHHHHRHHSRNSLHVFLSPLRDTARIFGSFFQRIRYLVHNWWLYR